jgi:hypothetical protein
VPEPGLNNGRRQKVSFIREANINENVNKQIWISNDTVLTEHSERFCGEEHVIQDSFIQIHGVMAG